MATPAAAPPKDKEKGEKKPVQPRPYGLYTEVELDLTDAPAAVEQLQKLVNADNVTVLAVVGRAVAISPKEAIKAVAQNVELSGSYITIADNGLTVFNNVTSKMERAVKIGG